MSREVNAEIIAIGTEILLGEITDTNSVYIARLLRDLGINLYYMTSVGDNEARIAEAIRIALNRGQVVITCGGLGPTVDDMTRQAVAAATNRGLTFHQELLDLIAQRFATFRARMTENNRRQAYVPDGAVIVENPVGTAPAFIVETEQGVVISLPGVPREMKFLLNERIVPYLRDKFNLGGTVIKARVLKTAGIGESMLDEAIGTTLLEAGNPTVGLAAHSGQVDVRITAKAPTTVQAEEMIERVEAELRTRIGSYIFGTDDDTIDRALLDTAASEGVRISIIEGGVPPVIGARLRQTDPETTLIANEVRHLSAEALMEAYHLPLSTSVRQLAERAAEASAQGDPATIGMAIVSRNDDAQDHADSDELSAIAVYLDGKLRSRSYGFGGGTDFVQQWGGTWLMSMAWHMLKERRSAT
ncbi:CinA family nicotinamide mononucleotide deamidase-related protein [Anaerolineae bacterium CFX9]|nr:CinA family nicotinamide mononucleotide deamidase-related protein [Anaerolineae bacterium CFX9]